MSVALGFLVRVRVRVRRGSSSGDVVVAQVREFPRYRIRDRGAAGTCGAGRVHLTSLSPPAIGLRIVKAGGEPGAGEGQRQHQEQRYRWQCQPLILTQSGTLTYMDNVLVSSYSCSCRIIHTAGDAVMVMLYHQSRLPVKISPESVLLFTEPHSWTGTAAAFESFIRVSICAMRSLMLS